MQAPRPLSPAGLVSCDIVGHSNAQRHEIQVVRIEAINEIVHAAMSSCGPRDVAWASGGDGGHLVFLDGDWRRPALELVSALRQWAIRDAVPLRVTADLGARGPEQRRSPTLVRNDSTPLSLAMLPSCFGRYMTS